MNYPYVTAKDRVILRALASKIAAIASLDIQQQKKTLWRRLNRLEMVRPMVWINPWQLPWHEIGMDKSLECESALARDLEQNFRRTLYQWRHFPGDMVVENVFYCPLVIEQGSFGLEQQCEKIYNTNESDIASHAYERLIHSEKDVEKLRTPEVFYGVCTCGSTNLAQTPEPPPSARSRM